jgi:SAM-dependent methyltransferase
MSAAALDQHFENLYRGDDDPWQVRERWYEQRKRALVLASLPRRRYRNGYEAGCGNGEMTVALARRCDHLLAADASSEALRAAHLRLQEEESGGLTTRRIELAQQRLPVDWPRREQPFDLIVVSELAYYLSSADLGLLVAHCVGSLAPQGTLVLCHWRPDFADRLISTDEVHGAFAAAPALHRLARHEEDDFILDVFSDRALSVARQEDAS